jgi:hypothetical protein
MTTSRKFIPADDESLRHEAKEIADVVKKQIQKKDTKPGALHNFLLTFFKVYLANESNALKRLKTLWLFVLEQLDRHDLHRIHRKFKRAKLQAPEDQDTLALSRTMHETLFEARRYELLEKLMPQAKKTTLQILSAFKKETCSPQNLIEPVFALYESIFSYFNEESPIILHTALSTQTAAQEKKAQDRHGALYDPAKRLQDLLVLGLRQLSQAELREFYTGWETSGSILFQDGLRNYIDELDFEPASSEACGGTAVRVDHKDRPGEDIQAIATTLYQFIGQIGQTLHEVYHETFRDALKPDEAKELEEVPPVIQEKIRVSIDWAYMYFQKASFRREYADDTDLSLDVTPKHLPRDTSQTTILARLHSSSIACSLQDPPKRRRHRRVTRADDEGAAAVNPQNPILSAGERATALVKTSPAALINEFMREPVFIMEKKAGESDREFMENYSRCGEFQGKCSIILKAFSCATTHVSDWTKDKSEGFDAEDTMHLITAFIENAVAEIPKSDLKPTFDKVNSPEFIALLVDSEKILVLEENHLLVKHALEIYCQKVREAFVRQFPELVFAPHRKMVTLPSYADRNIRVETLVHKHQMFLNLYQQVLDPEWDKRGKLRFTDYTFTADTATQFRKLLENMPQQLDIHTMETVQDIVIKAEALIKKKHQPLTNPFTVRPTETTTFLEGAHRRFIGQYSEVEVQRPPGDFHPTTQQRTR